MKKLPAPKSLVPDSFTLAGTRWQVVHITSMENLGQTERDEAKILMRAGLDQQIAESTFFHELFHAIMFTMGIDEAKHDEREIDAMAAFMHQFMLTRGHD